MKNKNDDLIIRCLADKFMPLALVFGIYVILHGHLSPGGGFQGGTLCASAVLLIYLGYGAEGTCKTLHPNFLRQTEPVALIIYICIAIAGIAAGYNFCTNFYFDADGIHDMEDLRDQLRVRWDLDGDGNWDTDYSKERIIRHSYTQPGTYV
ncbi:MAG: hypothetical protein EOM14_17240, partial [Clostridia bacterium]|nr:hypothetical protein [Clostridia bacterium]